MRNHCLGAVARPWRAGAGAGDFAGRTDRGDRQLRFDRDPLVAGAKCRRTGAAFPCRRRQRGGAARRRRAATAGADGRIAIWTAGKTEPDAVLEGHTAPIVGACGLARRRDAGLGVMGSNRAAVAACGRRAARARGPYAKRQRRGVRARRPHAGQRQLRSERADLAAVGPISRDHRGDTEPAQRGRDRRRRRDRGRRRRRQGLFP